MTVAERLVLKRQRHLKWRALDPLFAAFGLTIERPPVDDPAAAELRVGGAGLRRDATRSVEPHMLRAATVDARDDPRLSLCACTLGLASPGETVVEHAAQALRAVFPGFVETARSLGAEIEYT